MTVASTQKSMLTATFKDKDLERSYKQYARDLFSDRDRIMMFTAITIWMLYTLLDYVVLQNARFEIIALRLGIFVGAIALTSLTFFDFGKRYLHQISVGVVSAGGIAVSFMIWMEGSITPPYYIGLIIVSMILNNMARVSFPISVLVFTVWYLSFVPAIPSSASEIEIFSAHFFVLNAFLLAAGANYFLEINRREEFLKYSENQRYSQQLRVMMDDANRSLKRKNAVLNTLTHVFKTPLHQIIGHAQILEQAPLGPHSVPEYAEYSRNIHEAGDSMLRLVRRLLTYSRLDSGSAELNFQRTTTSEIIDCALSRFQEDLADRNITVSIPEDRLRIKADGAMLEMAVFELLENAIAASPEGSTLTIETEADDTATTITIADEGTGIDLDRIDAIEDTLERTEEFLHVGDKISLGVTLANRIVMAHGGQLTFSHAGDHGTRATITLPHQADEPAGQPREEPPATQKGAPPPDEAPRLLRAS